MNRSLPHLVVFALGLAAVLWIAAGYIGASPLALAVTVSIGALYLVGARELLRYRRATATLEQANAALSQPPPSLGDWLAPLDPSLRQAVRLRVEGERVPLPAPALTPYLVGLLVLLGMLGTLLGMMLTLRGTGMALETATDLQAIRDSLAAPVKGLGFAFGTAIAGVATSAMLGLLSALCRRERQDAVHALDARIATTLHAHSQAHQRTQMLALLQQQADAMPTLVDRMHAMASALERHSLAANERQAQEQAAFHARAEDIHAQLAHAARQSIERNASESVRIAGEALRPAVEATMAALARDAGALHEAVAHAAQAQMQALAGGLESGHARIAALWEQALATQARANTQQAADLRDAMDRFTGTFEQRSAQLLDGLAGRLDATAGGLESAWRQALARQDAANEAMATRNGDALAAAAGTFEQHAAALLGHVDHAHAELQARLAAQDEQRLAAWTAQLASTGESLRGHWTQAGAQLAERQQQVCETLASTAREITAQSKAQAGDTIAEISRLVQAASEAPRAAADVVAELRQKLSDSMVRDSAMLEERAQLLGTLGTLLDAVNHASTEQRAAIDALVTTSADLLERVGTRFTDQVEAEAGKLAEAATQVEVGATEVASMGDAFGAAVQVFGDANERLMERLQRIEGALDRSLARSDEQLAYYVAQAREVIDLSLLTQQQIIGDLQQLQASRPAPAAEAA